MRKFFRPLLLLLAVMPTTGCGVNKSLDSQIDPKNAALAADSLTAFIPPNAVRDDLTADESQRDPDYAAQIDKAWSVPNTDSEVVDTLKAIQLTGARISGVTCDPDASSYQLVIARPESKWLGTFQYLFEGERVHLRAWIPNKAFSANETLGKATVANACPYEIAQVVQNK